MGIKIEHNPYGDLNFDRILKAWQAFQGPYSRERYLFIAHLSKPVEERTEAREGNFAAFLRRPNIETGIYTDRTLDGYAVSFAEPGDAENEIWKFVYGERGRGWRIREIEVSFLPTEINRKVINLLEKEAHKISQ